MVASPVPTRAEASDVATAIYHGADAVMLSAESASGKYPVEAVTMMDRIVSEVEGDPYYRELLNASQTPPEPTIADAVCSAIQRVASLVPIAATVTYTTSGFTSLRAARERPESPILSMTPRIETARRLALVWGIHSVHTGDVGNVTEMVDRAREAALAEGFARRGDTIVITAGMPFGTPGATNLLRIAEV
jgi:pyruvate kinase